MSRRQRRPPRAFASQPRAPPAPRLRAGEGSLLAGGPRPSPPACSPAPRPPGAHAPAGQLRRGKFKNAARPAGRPATCLPRAATRRAGRSRRRQPPLRRARASPGRGARQAAGREEEEPPEGRPGGTCPAAPLLRRGRAGRAHRFRPRGLERGRPGALLGASARPLKCWRATRLPLPGRR